MQNVLPFALFAWGEERISASLGSVLNATTPLFTAVIAAAAFLPGEQLDRRRGIALASGLAGVVVIMQPWRSGSGEVLGQLACLTAAACYGVGFVFTSRYITGRMHSTAAAVGQVMSGAVMATVIAAIATAVSGDTPHVDLHIVGAMLALGALGTGFAYLLVFRLMEAVGPTATSAVTFVMPIVGVLLGVVVLDERIGWNVAIGGVLVLVSIRFVRQKRALEAEGVAATS
jgi:drug/metabolite transporter (DMT)-like permease